MLKLIYKKRLVFFFCGLSTTAGYFLVKDKIESLLGKQPAQIGATEELIKKSESGKKQSWCDKNLGLQRLAVAKAVDHFRTDLDRLWRERKPPETKDKQGMIRVGPIELMPKTDRKLASEMDSTDWNWNDTYNKLNATQHQPDAAEKLWLEVDTAAQYLAKRDVDRTHENFEFLPQAETKHIFRINNEGVKRTEKSTIEITLDPGDFESSKEMLKKLIEEEWNFKQNRLKIVWNQGNSQIYKFVATKSSGKSFVDHRAKTIQISAFAPVRTLAHEIGHVLGFSDHYYDVWHDVYCYYTQEFRVTDLMSDSANGGVHQQHWNILSMAYPLGKPQNALKFVYSYGN